MAETGRTAIGIEIGGTKLQAVLGDGRGRIARRWRAAVEPSAGSEGIRRHVLQAIAELRRAGEPLAIGVGFGGPVDRWSGRIARSHQVRGWENFPLRDWLVETCGIRAIVENDANAAALAEATCGAGRGASPVFYFNLGSGVGGGLVIDGSIYHGLPPGEAEFGHLKLDRSGQTVESRCSGWAIDRRIRQAAASLPDGFLAERIGPIECGEAKHLAAALERGDPLAQTILAELADDLGLALSHVVHLLHPAAIVMGGGLALVGEALRDAAERSMRKDVMDAFAPGPPLRLAELGEDAVPTGALLLAGRVVSLSDEASFTPTAGDPML